jgi:hypothetical protein
VIAASLEETSSFLLGEKIVLPLWVGMGMTEYTWGRAHGKMSIFNSMVKHSREGGQEKGNILTALALGKESIGKLLHLIPRDGPYVFLPECWEQIEPVGLRVQIIGPLLTVCLHVSVQPGLEVGIERPSLLLVFDFKLPQGNLSLNLFRNPFPPRVCWTRFALPSVCRGG